MKTQNPTAQTMPEHRRREIALTATRCGARIIEDDPYWLLADNAPPPVAHFAPLHVYYISTLSKCLTPGLRTAFVLLPDVQRRDGFLAALRSFALMSTPLTTALMTQWIHGDSAARLLAGVQAEARARQYLASQIVARMHQIPCEGLHVWLTLPSYWTSQDFARTAGAEGLAVTSSDAFCVGPRPPNAIRIFDDHKEAGSLWYIIRCNPHATENAAKACHINIDDLKAIAPKLRHIRDKTHFHIDRRTVGNPSLVWTDANISNRAFTNALHNVALLLAKIKQDVFRAAMDNQTPYDGSDVMQIIDAYAAAQGR